MVTQLLCVAVVTVCCHGYGDTALITISGNPCEAVSVMLFVDIIHYSSCSTRIIYQRAVLSKAGGSSGSVVHLRSFLLVM